MKLYHGQRSWNTILDEIVSFIWWMLEAEMLTWRTSEVRSSDRDSGIGSEAYDEAP
jgi:hypothetical protein